MKKKVFLILALVLVATTLLFSVYADTEPKGSLTLTKLETGKTDGEGDPLPLAGVTFKIYKVGDFEESTATPAEGTTAVATVTTGTDGVAAFTDLEAGRYLVVETDAPANVTKRMNNFLVDIPMTNAAGDGFIWDVVASPKNETDYGTVELTKHGMTDDVVLQGVVFKLQKKTGNAGTEADWTDVEGSTNLTTGTDGKISVSGLEVGQYRFVEVSTVDKYILDKDTTHGFIVDMTGEGGRANVDPAEISVYNDEPHVKKETKDAPDDKSFNIGDEVEYIVTADVPKATVKRLNTFKFVDTMSEGLDYVANSLVVKGVTGTGDSATRTTLTKDTDYTVTYDDTTRKLTVVFVGENIETYDSIEATYKAEINEDAVIGTEGNENEVKLVYSKDTDTDETWEDGDEEKVYTGGFKIEKVDRKDTTIKLEGAEFKIAASEDDAKNAVWVTDKDDNVIVLTTDANGKADYKGLAYGTYYLVETKAPAYTVTEEVDSVETEVTKYYNLLRNPLTLTINATSYEEENRMQIKNSKGFKLPETGAIGAAVLLVVGAEMIIASRIIKKRQLSK